MADLEAQWRDTHHRSSNWHARAPNIGTKNSRRRSPRWSKTSPTSPSRQQQPLVERSVKPRQVKAWPHDVSHSEEGGQRTDEEVLGGEASWEEEITDADMS